MPPKKSTENGTAQVDANKPDEASLLFAFELLKAVGDDGALDMGALSKAMGHTNIASTRNAFNRHKKRWGFGNINTKNTSGSATAIDEGVDPVALKPNNDTNKVAKKRGRPSTKGSPSKKAPAVDSSDDNQAAHDVKSEGSDTD